MNTTTEPTTDMWADAIAKRLVDEPWSDIQRELQGNDNKYLVTATWMALFTVFGLGISEVDGKTPREKFEDAEQLLAAHLRTMPITVREMIGSYIIEEDYFDDLP